MAGSAVIPFPGAHRLAAFLYRHGHLNVRRREECATLVRWLDPRPGERILDIGSGDGWWDHRIAARGATVVGIDMNGQRLAIAAARNGGPQIEYRQMDAHRLEFADDSFDKVVSMCVLEHLRDDAAVLREVARVLRPGGAFVLSCDSMSCPELSAAERENHRQRYAVNRYYDTAELRRRLEAAGLAVEQLRYILTTSMAVSVFRASWAVEDFEESPMPGRAFLGEVAGGLVNTVGAALIRAAELFARRPDCGLTLLARARRATW